MSPAGRLAVHVLTGSRTARVLDRPLLVGRSRDCELRVDDDATCSRVHLQIAPLGALARITDIDGSTGTFVNGMRLRGPLTVARGIVRFGDQVAALGPAAETDAAAASESVLVGGAALAACRRIAHGIAPTAQPLWITGEPGTGKELAARWVHQLSRRTGPLIPVNCEMRPESLLEAELFGYAGGGHGLVAAARTGTLFLDEIGELPLRLQDALARELANASDVRVIASTTADLAVAVERGAFSAELYTRLANVQLAMPALRARIDDLPLLVGHLVKRAGAAPEIAPDALEALARYRWPQNVRQLDFALRRALAQSPGRIELAHLPEEMTRDFRAHGPASPTPITREQLDSALSRFHGNVRRVGKALGIPRSRLYRLLDKWSLDPGVHRAGGFPRREGSP